MRRPRPFPEETKTERMEGLDPESAVVSSELGHDPVLHFTGRFGGKGNREDLVRRHVVMLDQVDEPGCQCAGFAGPGSSDDAERTTHVVGSGRLLGAERVGLRLALRRHVLAHSGR